MRNHCILHRVLRGGVAVYNPLSKDGMSEGGNGTVSLVATSDGADEWIVGCYHVLARVDRNQPLLTKERILQPDQPMNDPCPTAVVDPARTSARLDVAAARIGAPFQAAGEALGFGWVRGLADPKVGMRVSLCGAVTGVSEGVVSQIVGDFFTVVPIGDFPDEYELTQPGDSGALWLEPSTRRAVGFHREAIAAGGRESQAVVAATALAALGLRLPPV